MRPVIQLADGQSVPQVLKQAGRMADQVDRLRYLRSAVTVCPGRPRGIDQWLDGLAVWIIAAAATAVGFALVLWRIS